MSNVIDSIQLSGVTYGIKGSGGTETIELTQAQYDALVDKDPSTFYVITDAEAGDLTNYYTKSETNTLLGSKADTATTYTKTETDNAITAATSTKQDTLVSGTNIKTINNESILGSGNIDIQGGGGSSYSAGTGIDITNNVISVTGKVDTTTYTAYTAATDTALASKQTTLTAGTGISIVDNVISATGGGGGGGKAVAAGTNISVTTGETADTINCTIPIEVGNGDNSIGIGTNTLNNAARVLAVGYRNIISNLSSNSLVGGLRSSIGYNCANSIAFGYEANVGSKYSCSIGSNTKTSNDFEAAFGRYNASNTGSTDADKTRFSVGNGTDDNARHNAFEIRQNGDIYLNNGTNDVKLQDYLQIKVVKLTQSAYDALSPNYDSNTLYIIKD